MDWIFLRKAACVVFAISAVVTSRAVSAQNSADAQLDHYVEIIKEKNPDLFKFVSQDKLRTYLGQVRESMASHGAKPAPPMNIFVDAMDPETAQRIRDYVATHGNKSRHLHVDRTKAYVPGKRPPSTQKNLPTNVISDVEVGDSVPWPSDADAAKSFGSGTPYIPPSERPVTDYASKFTAKHERIMPEIPRCPKDVTLTHKFGPVERTEKAVKDILFVRTEIKSSTDELFGKTTQVYRYTADAADPTSRAIVGMHVPCLPFRMRMSQHATVQDFGLNALKNYDRNFTGVGEVTPYVAANKTRLLE